MPTQKLLNDLAAMTFEIARRIEDRSSGKVRAQSCYNCVYLLKESFAPAFCLRYPPAQTETMFPIVHEMLWCGEWKGGTMEQLRCIPTTAAQHMGEG